MKTILDLNKKCKQLIDASIPINRIKETGILDYVVKMKYDIPNDNLEKFSEYESCPNCGGEHMLFRIGADYD